MSESRRKQSEQEVRPQFDAFMNGFQGLSYTAANSLMLYITTMLIELSRFQQAVKLAELLISGKVVGVAAEFAANLNDRLQVFYQGNADLKMTMLHEQPFVKDVTKLRSASVKLDENLNKLATLNLEKSLEMKKQAGPAPSNDKTESKEGKDDYTPPKPKSF